MTDKAVEILLEDNPSDVELTLPLRSSLTNHIEVRRDGAEVDFILHWCICTLLLGTVLK